MPHKYHYTMKRNIIESLEQVMAIVPDKLYLTLKYRYKLGKRINWTNPTTFNEKMQWLKLYNRKDIFTTMVDKYEVKQYVTRMIGEKYVIPTLGVYDSFEDIDFSRLPQKFVLKCTHDSGSVTIIKDKKEINREELKRKFSKCLKKNYYIYGREYPYKNVKRRILVEEFFEDRDNENLIAYKIFTFSGRPYFTQVIQNDKKENETVDYYDLSWKRLDIMQAFSNSKKNLPMPKGYEKMLQFASTLSYGIPFLRVDFYSTYEGIFFSELTFFSDSGFAKFNPAIWDELLGKMIILPK